MNLFKISLKQQRADVYIWMRLGLLVILTALAAGLVFVLYRDFYQTIVQAETVLVLKQEVALKDLNLDLFRKVQKIHSYKITSQLPDPIPDPFATTESAPAPAEPETIGSTTATIIKQ